MQKTMTSDEAFAQGARCGHLEGKNRAGLYVIGEEFELSEIAAEAQGSLLPTGHLMSVWASGYRHGYLLACEGSPLDENLRESWVR